MNLPGYGDPATWPACTNHPNDPRTDDDGREEWEAFVAFVDIIDEGEIEDILAELLRGNPETARAALEKTVEAHYQQWIAAQEQQDAEDAARDRAEARADARYWEAA